MSETKLEFEGFRKRLQQLSDQKLVRYGKAARYLAEAHHSADRRPIEPVFVLQFRECREEWPSRWRVGEQRNLRRFGFPARTQPTDGRCQSPSLPCDRRLEVRSIRSIRLSSSESTRDFPSARNRVRFTFRGHRYEYAARENGVHGTCRRGGTEEKSDR